MIILIIDLLFIIMLTLAFNMKAIPKISNYFFMFFGGLTYILLAVSTSSNVSQDRLQYFINYEVEQHLTFNILSKDSLFHLLIKILPDGLNITEYTAIIALITFLLFVILIKVFEFKGLIQSKYSPYIILIILSDRMIMDLFLNTTRSSWALMIFLLGFGLAIGQRSSFSKPVWFVAFFIHMGASIFAIISYIVYIFTRRFLSVIICILIFSIILKIFSGLPHIQYDSLIDYYYYYDVYQFPDFNFIRVEEAFKLTKNHISVSLSIMILTSVILPLLIILYRRGVSFVINDFLFGYLVLLLLVTLFLYIDLSLSFRFFVVPLIGFLFFLRLKDLQILAIFKLFLFFGYSYGIY
jgi:hypothetical protein